MFSFVQTIRALFFFATFFAIVSAFPGFSHHHVPTSTKAAPPAATPSGQCNTGSTHCCQQVKSCQSDDVKQSFGILGLPIPGPESGDVGINCASMSFLDFGKGECNASPVCCQNNNFNGLINTGCSPISL